MAHALYSSARGKFGVYEACYLIWLRQLTLRAGRSVAVLRSATQPYTEVAFELKNNALLALGAGQYPLKTGGTLRVDAQHVVQRSIQP